MTTALTEKEWHEFQFSEIFDIKKGFYNKKPEDDGAGTIPFLGATDSNNGITQFLTLDEIKSSTKTGAMPNSPLNKKYFPGNAIAVTNNGSVGHAYYQPTPFTCSHDINPLYLRDHEMSCAEAAFLIKAIEEQGKLFQYARKWRPVRMVKSRLLLPVNDAGLPDYEYMEKYALNMRETLLSRYKQYVEMRIANLSQKKIPALREKEWRDFVLEDIFSIDSGKRLETRNKKLGTRPFIGATDNGNGVTGFVSNDNSSKDSNVLGVNYNGNGMCIGFYHPYECIFSDDVKRFHLKNYEDNVHVLLFLKVVILQQKSKFGYLYKFNAARMTNQRLLMPVTDGGKPDYAYMEQYAKNLMLKKYKQYLAFSNSCSEKD